jgi:hypothetical protein
MKCIACPRNECACLIYCTNLLHELKFCTEISVLSALNEVQSDPGMSLPLPSLLSCLVRRREAGEVCLPLRFKRRKLAYQSSSLMHEKSKRSGVVARVCGVGVGCTKGVEWKEGTWHVRICAHASYAHIHAHRVITARH